MAKLRKDGYTFKSAAELLMYEQLKAKHPDLEFVVNEKHTAVDDEGVPKDFEIDLATVVRAHSNHSGARAYGIEIDGGTKFGRSSHSRGKGYENDRLKDRAYRRVGGVLDRFTTEQVNTGQAIKMATTTIESIREGLLTANVGLDDAKEYEMALKEQNDSVLRSLEELKKEVLESYENPSSSLSKDGKRRFVYPGPSELGLAETIPATSRNANAFKLRVYLHLGDGSDEQERFELEQKLATSPTPELAREMDSRERYPSSYQRVSSEAILERTVDMGQSPMELHGRDDPMEVSFFLEPQVYRSTIAMIYDLASQSWYGVCHFLFSPSISPEIKPEYVHAALRRGRAESSCIFKDVKALLASSGWSVVFERDYKIPHSIEGRIPYSVEQSLKKPEDMPS